MQCAQFSHPIYHVLRTTEGQLVNAQEIEIKYFVRTFEYDWNVNLVKLNKFREYDAQRSHFTRIFLSTVILLTSSLILQAGGVATLGQDLQARIRNYSSCLELCERLFFQPLVRTHFFYQ